MQEIPIPVIILLIFFKYKIQINKLTIFRRFGYC